MTQPEKVMPRFNRSHTSGFTIIELLVVLSIIVLLIAILLPSMRRAKEVTRRTVCASQQHQLSVLCLDYASDNFTFVFPGYRDWYPAPNDEHTPWISSMMFDYIAERNPPKNAKPGTNGFKYDSGRIPILGCPNFDNGFSSGRRTQVSRTRPVGWVIGYNYLGGKPLTEAYNRNNPIGDGANKQWVSAKRLSDPAHAGLWADHNNWHTGGAWTFVAHLDFGPLNTDGYGNRSIGGTRADDAGSAGGNVATLDGSVRWKDIQDMIEHHSFSHGPWYPALW